MENLLWNPTDFQVDFKVIGFFIIIKLHLNAFQMAYLP